LVTPIRTASDVTTLNDAASWSGHLLIGIIDHDHNSALDLFRRAVRWRAHPPSSRTAASQRPNDPPDKPPLLPNNQIGAS